MTSGLHWTSGLSLTAKITLWSDFLSAEHRDRLHCKYACTALLANNESHILHEGRCVEEGALISFICCPVCCYDYFLTCAYVCGSCCVCVCCVFMVLFSRAFCVCTWCVCVCLITFLSSALIIWDSVCVPLQFCDFVFLQSKSVSSTDSQPAEERQGPSGGYSSSQGGAEAKRRRCDDKESLPPHSYVCVPF